VRGSLRLTFESGLLIWFWFAVAIAVAAALSPPTSDRYANLKERFAGTRCFAASTRACPASSERREKGTGPAFECRFGRAICGCILMIPPRSNSSHSMRTNAQRNYRSASGCASSHIRRESVARKTNYAFAFGRGLLLRRSGIHAAKVARGRERPGLDGAKVLRASNTTTELNLARLFAFRATISVSGRAEGGGGDNEFAKMMNVFKDYTEGHAMF